MKEDAIKVFRKNGGLLRMCDALKLGINRSMLYSLRDAGIVEQVSRGIYRLSEMSPIGNPDLVTVSLRCRSGVVCLVSALAFHGLTTQIPHSVFVAIKRGTRAPKIQFPPLQVHRFGEQTYLSGIEIHEMDGISVKIYSPEKTLADCFKFRNKIGMDVVLEALHFYGKRRKTNLGEVLKQAEICRVKNTMKPYLETMI